VETEAGEEGGRGIEVYARQDGCQAGTTVGHGVGMEKMISFGDDSFQLLELYSRA
jgi:hypothetical protein